MEAKAAKHTWNDHWWSRVEHSIPASGPCHPVLNDVTVHCGGYHRPAHAHCCTVKYSDSDVLKWGRWCCVCTHTVVYVSCSVACVGVCVCIGVCG